MRLARLQFRRKDHEHLDSTPKPIILAAKQTFTRGLETLSAMFGGMVTAQFKALGVIGVVTDGPMRDYGEIKDQNVQYLATGFTSGHGPLHLRDKHTDHDRKNDDSPRRNHPYGSMWSMQVSR